MFGWIQTYLQELLGKRFAASLARHAMTALGAALVAVPNLDPQVVSQFLVSGEHVLTGLLLVAFGALWSLADKVKTEKK